VLNPLAGEEDGVCHGLLTPWSGTGLRDNPEDCRDELVSGQARP